MYTLYKLPSDYLLRTNDKLPHELTTGYVRSREEELAELNLLLPLRQKNSKSQLGTNLPLKTILENWPDNNASLVLVVFMDKSCQFVIFKSSDDFQESYATCKKELFENNEFSFHRCYFSCDSEKLVEKISLHVKKDEDCELSEDDLRFMLRRFAEKNEFFAPIKQQRTRNNPPKPEEVMPTVSENNAHQPNDESVTLLNSNTQKTRCCMLL